MGFELFRLVGNVVLNTSEALTGLSNVENRATRAGEVLGRVGQGVSNFGKALTVGLTLPIVGILGKSIQLASDLAESANVVNVTFGKSAKEVIAWTKTLNEKFGLVQLEAMKYVGSMGAMLKSSGLSAKASREMAQRLVELTGDMSSFYNLSHEETWEKIRAGIGGETEPLKVLGINMSVVNMEAYALSRGINKTWREMSQAEQTTLRYNYILSVTKDAQGDFNRTSEGFENKLRAIQGKLQDVAVKLGTILLPYVEKFLLFIDKWVDKLNSLNPKMQKVAIIVGLLTGVIGPLILVFGTLTGIIAGVVTIIGAIGLSTAAVIAGIGLWIVEMGALILVLGNVARKAGLLKIVIDTLKDIFMVFSNIIKNDFNKASDILIKKFGYSKDEAKKFIDSAIKLRDNLIDLGNAFKELAKDGGNLILDFFKKIGQYILDHKKEIAEAIRLTMDFINKFIDLSKKLYKLHSDIKNFLLEMEKYIAEVFTSIPEEFEKFKKSVSKKFTEIKQDIERKLNEWETAIKNWFNSLPSKTVILLKNWGRAIVKWTDEQNKENVRQFGIWWTNIKKWFDSIPSKIDTAIKNWGTSIKKWFDNTKKSISTKLSNWWTTIKNWFTSRPGQIEKSLNSWRTSIKNKFEQARTDIKNKLDNWWSTMKGWFSRLPNKPEVKNAGKNMVKKVSQGTSEKKKDFMDKLGKLIVDVIVGAGKLAFVAAIATGREIIKRIIKGVGEKKNSLSNKLKELPYLVIQQLQIMAIKGWTYGKNLIQNIIDGVSSKIQSLKNKVKAVAQTTADYLGWSSPTKEGPGKTSDKWGGNLISMLSEKMLSKKNLLKNTVSELANDLNFNNISANVGINKASIDGRNQGNAGRQVILQINNPKFFNQEDISKIMNPVINRLEALNVRSR